MEDCFLGTIMQELTVEKIFIHFFRFLWKTAEKSNFFFSRSNLQHHTKKKKAFIKIFPLIYHFFCKILYFRETARPLLAAIMG